jgi:hypothetical protein
MAISQQLKRSIAFPEVKPERVVASISNDEIGVSIAVEIRSGNGRRDVTGGHGRSK